MEWRSYGPVLLAVVLFLLVGTIFEKRIEQALRSFIERRRNLYLRQEAEQTATQLSATITDCQNPRTAETIELKPINVVQKTTTAEKNIVPVTTTEPKSPSPENQKPATPAGPLNVGLTKVSYHFDLQPPTVKDLKTSEPETKKLEDTNAQATELKKNLVQEPATSTTAAHKTSSPETKTSNVPEIKKTVVSKTELEANAASKSKPNLTIPTRTSSLPTVSKIHLSTLTNELNSKSTSKRSLLTCKSAAMLNTRNMEPSRSQRNDEKNDHSPDEHNFKFLKK